MREGSILETRSHPANRLSPSRVFTSHGLSPKAMTKQSSLHDSVGRLPGPRSATLDQTAESLEESAAALGEIRKTSNARRVHILKLDFSIPSPSSVRKGQMGAAESQG